MGHATEWFVSKLQDFAEEVFFIQKVARYRRKLQKPSEQKNLELKRIKKTVFPSFGDGRAKKQLWFVKVPPFLSVYARRNDIGDDLSFIQYVECRRSIDQKYETLGCDFL